MGGLEFVVDELYSLRELEDAGYEPLRFFSSHTIFTDEDASTGYIFKVEPFKKLNIRFKYEKSVRLPETPVWTDYEREQYEEDLKNCCGPLRLGIDYIGEENDS